MKIYIELIIFIILLLIFFVWKIWFKTSKKKLLKKYSIDNDRSKNGELKRREELERIKQGAISGNESGTSNEIADSSRPTESEGCSILPKAASSSPGKNSSFLRKFFKRRK